MSTVADLESALSTYVKPLTYPIGVKMSAAGETVPEKVKVPSRDFKMRIAICQATSLARKYGWVLSLGKEDQTCPIGSVVLGFQPPIPFYLEGSLCEGMYTRTKEAGARSEAAVKRFPYGKYEKMLIGAASRLGVDPDLIIVYGNAAQVMRLVHAALYNEGGTLTSSFSGRGECSEMIVNTMESGRCQVILPGNGERVFGHTQDDEMAFTIPFGKIKDVIEGLEGTHKGGVRYPITSFLMYEAKFPPKYKELEAMWQQAGGGGSDEGR